MRVISSACSPEPEWIRDLAELRSHRITYFRMITYWRLGFEAEKRNYHHSTEYSHRIIAIACMQIYCGFSMVPLSSGFSDSGGTLFRAEFITFPDSQPGYRVRLNAEYGRALQRCTEPLMFQFARPHSFAIHTLPRPT